MNIIFSKDPANVLGEISNIVLVRNDGYFLNETGKMDTSVLKLDSHSAWKPERHAL